MLTPPRRASCCTLLAGALCALLTAHSPAASVAPGTAFTAGVALDPGTTNSLLGGSLAGTVLADVTSPFVDMNVPANFQGTLRSLVVRRTDTSTLDFYYQLANTSPAPQPLEDPEIFRFTLDGVFSGFGFAGDNLGVIYRTDGLADLIGAGTFANGTEGPVTADRDTDPAGGVGFQFSTDPLLSFDDPRNVDAGEVSRFLVVRTTATEFTSAPGAVSGLGVAQISTSFAPVPEPGAVALFGFGALAFGLRRRGR